MGQNARPTAPAADVNLHELLLGLGFGGRNEALARKALEEAQLTRPGKQAIAASKRERAVAVLRARYLVACPRTACQAAAKEEGRGQKREVLPAERQADCEVCSGSHNRLAIDRLCKGLSSQGIHKVAVIGGSPNARESLSGLVGERLQLRLVDGVVRRTRAEARNDLLWADLIIVWGSTQLDHKVSTLYTDGGDDRVIVVHRRGIAALVEEVLEKPPRRAR